MAKKIFCILMIMLLAAGCISGCGAQNSEGADGITSGEHLDNARIGILTGVAYADSVYETFPNADISRYNLISDMILAVKQDRIDSFILDIPYVVSIMWDVDGLKYISVPVERQEYAFVFAKDDRAAALRSEMDAFLEAKEADGTLDELQNKWFSDTECDGEIDRSGLTGENGTLKMATCSDSKPFVYVKNAELTGYDIELAYMFCRENGYDLEIDDLAFTSLIAGVVSGKYDFGGASVAITEERRESIDFSMPYYSAEMAAVVEGSAEDVGFFESITNSFKKNFIQESRWKMILEGIAVTLIITILSAVFGTLLGFAFYLLCHTGNKLINRIFALYVRILEGTPIVVLLMILFYIVFSIDGIWVSVVAFSLTMAAFVCSTLIKSVSGIGVGQREAALALGYSERKSFFKLILPQAMKPFVSEYQGQIVSLIKDTAVVGYIAVEDLTKMSDIIRSNTYEAFFPLIATAIIYMLLAWTMIALIGRVKIRFDTTRRKPEKVLKGVKR